MLFVFLFVYLKLPKTYKVQCPFLWIFFGIILKRLSWVQTGSIEERMSYKKMKTSGVWIKNNTAQRGLLSDLRLQFPFHCLPREQETSNRDDQMKAGKTQLSGSKDKASSLQYHSLNPDIRGEGRREVAGSSRMVFWGRGRDYANQHAIVLSKVFPYRDAQPLNSATASTFCVVSV